MKESKVTQRKKKEKSRMGYSKMQAYPVASTRTGVLDRGAHVLLKPTGSAGAV